MYMILAKQKRLISCNPLPYVQDLLLFHPIPFHSAIEHVQMEFN